MVKEEVRKLLASLVFEEEDKKRWEIVSKLIKEDLGEYDGVLKKLKAKADMFDEAISLLEWAVYRSDKKLTDDTISKITAILDLIQIAKELNNENN